jgi:hypothetical protein
LKVVQSATTGGMQSTQEGDYLAPDRYHVTGQVTIGGRDSGQQEMIVMGNDAFLKEARGQWHRTQVDRDKLELTRTRDQALIESLSKAKEEDVRFLGQENLNGTPSFVFQYVFTGSQGVPMKSQTKTWVGISDGMPHQVEIDAETSYQGKPVSVKSVTVYSDYNSDFKIESPM